jgi:hypothetical protein
MKADKFRDQQLKKKGFRNRYIQLIEDRIMAFEDAIFSINNLIYNEKEDLRHAKSFEKKKK